MPPQVTGEDGQMHLRGALRDVLLSYMQSMPTSGMCLTSHLIFREKREVKKKNVHMRGQMMRPSQNILASASVPLLLSREVCTHTQTHIAIPQEVRLKMATQ